MAVRLPSGRVVIAVFVGATDSTARPDRGATVCVVGSLAGSAGMGSATGAVFSAGASLGSRMTVGAGLVVRKGVAGCELARA
jgi:hypothetical protein